MIFYSNIKWLIQFIEKKMQLLINISVDFRVLILKPSKSRRSQIVDHNIDVLFEYVCYYQSINVDRELLNNTTNIHWLGRRWRRNYNNNTNNSDSDMNRGSHFEKTKTGKPTCHWHWRWHKNNVRTQSFKFQQIS